MSRQCALSSTSLYIYYSTLLAVIPAAFSGHGCNAQHSLLLGLQAVDFAGSPKLLHLYAKAPLHATIVPCTAAKLMAVHGVI